MIPSPGRPVSQPEIAREVAGVCAAQSTLLVEMDCDSGLEQVSDWSALLTPEDVASFGCLRDLTARRRAIVRRAGLRAALAAGLRLPPRRVPLWHDESGRPHVGAPGQGDLLGLSCSSCEGLAVFCLAPCAEVGVDVEAWSDRRFPTELAPHLLHRAECVSFEMVPTMSKSSWLTGAWVCKEAWLKACGSGLTMDPCDLRLRCGADSDFLTSPEFGLPIPSDKQGFLRWDDTVAMAVVLSTGAPPLKRVRWVPSAV